jgi:hypothetical protein
MSSQGPGVFLRPTRSPAGESDLTCLPIENRNAPNTSGNANANLSHGRPLDIDEIACRFRPPPAEDHDPRHHTAHRAGPGERTPRVGVPTAPSSPPSGTAPTVKPSWALRRAERSRSGSALGGGNLRPSVKTCRHGVPIVRMWRAWPSCLPQQRRSGRCQLLRPIPLVRHACSARADVRADRLSLGSPDEAVGGKAELPQESVHATRRLPQLPCRRPSNAEAFRSGLPARRSSRPSRRPATTGRTKES